MMDRISRPNEMVFGKIGLMSQILANNQTIVYISRR